MFFQHNRCRACNWGPALAPEGVKTSDNGQRLIPVVDLGLQPLANNFRSDRDEREGFAPLKVLFCPNCSLAQLSVVVRPEILYADYCYLTSGSVTMANHFDRLFDDLGVAELNSIVEIGSNDGKMLAHWRNRKPTLKVVGVDPARNLAQIAFGRNIGTVVSVFNREAARAADAIVPDLVIARHVFCHAHNWEEFIDSLALMGHADTRYVIEVPYVKDLIEKVEWDTQYHEHLSYLSVKSMDALLSKSSLTLNSISEYPIHGGAIVLTLRRRASNTTQHESVNRFLSSENFTVETWTNFAIKMQSSIADLRSTVLTLVNEGKSVCGFGASAKSTVVVNACGFTRREIGFICDNTPQKQWKLSPGTDIQITDEGGLIREMPDYCLLFAWNWATEIIANNQAYLRAGGRFIIPGSPPKFFSAT